jgi:bleomycin hydrolase
MLAAIETEHFREGDSLDLSIRPVAEVQYSEVDMPTSGRAMGQTLLNLVERHGIYQEVCSPNDFLPLCTTRRKPYNQWIVPDLPDNWEHNQFFNCHPDSLLAFAIRAASAHRGVCWEGDISERGFSFQQGIAVTTLPPLLLYCKSLLRPPTDDHCMAIVGMAHDQHGRKYYLMKNSWGTIGRYRGFIYVSENYLRLKTVALAIRQQDA